MATSHTEKSGRDSNKGINPKLMLSSYAESLQGIVKQRYRDKVSVIGIDPFTIPQRNFNSECFPPVEACDLLSYLVLETSFYTNCQFKNFRSLQAYNQMVSGFISSILGQIISGKYVVVAKVRHSQRMNEPHVQLWIITNKDGTIISAHCAGCMAGLGECCSHIVSVLFYLEVWTRLNGKLACTQVKCTWLLPTTVKQVDYARVKDINFASARKMKSDLDKSIDNLDSSTAAENVCKSTTAKSNPLIQTPSPAELSEFYKSLSECQVKPSCLSLIHPYSETFISKTRNINAVTDLFDSKYMKLNYTELLKECHKVELNLSVEDIKLIERETVDQARGTAFFRHRAGRIGASRCRAACHTDPAQPSQSLIKSICYPNVFSFSTAATIHGCKHEEYAISEYTNQMKKIHQNFVVTNSGTFINQDFPFLHATPDFLCHCDCCGTGCGEVKCPYCLEGLDFENYILKKNSCLEKTDTKYTLKRDHDYFYQVQQQLHTTNRKYCDFVVFATNGTESRFIQERIYPDTEHWRTQIPKLTLFWRVCILPEVLGRWYTRKMDMQDEFEAAPKVGDCYCRQSLAEPTATCSNSGCPISKFHLSCLCIEKVPKTWLCPNCRKLPQFARSKKKTSSNEKDQFLTEAMKLETICTCKVKAEANDKLLKCHSENCLSGKFFHLNCLSYKRFPNNFKTNWVCSFCKIGKQNTKKSTDYYVENIPPAKNLGSNMKHNLKHDESSRHDHEVEFVGQTSSTKCVNKYDPIGKLTEHEFALIESPTGWLDCTIIHQAQVLLKQINPYIEGFQTPTLGPIGSFDLVSSEFVQILHTGGNHWVCVSSIGCPKGQVNLYDSLFQDIIADDVEDQSRNLVGVDFKKLNVVPVQQQKNGSDCGVFSIAYATSLECVHTRPKFCAV